MIQNVLVIGIYLLFWCLEFGAFSILFVAIVPELTSFFFLPDYKVYPAQRDHGRTL